MQQCGIPRMYIFVTKGTSYIKVFFGFRFAGRLGCVVGGGLSGWCPVRGVSGYVFRKYSSPSLYSFLLYLLLDLLCIFLLLEGSGMFDEIRQLMYALDGVHEAAYLPWPSVSFCRV